MKTYFRKMNNALIIIMLLVSVKACKEHSVGDPSQSFAGHWQLVSQKVSIGGPAKWSDVKNGNTYVFSEDGTWENESHQRCSTGTYEVSQDESQ